MKIMRTEAELKTIEDCKRLQERVDELEFQVETLGGEKQYLEHQISELNDRIREQSKIINSQKAKEGVTLWANMKDRMETLERERDYYKSLVNEQHYNKVI